MIKESKFRQYGFPREEIKGITIHETNNYSWNEYDLFNYLDNECKTSQGCHYIVGLNETLQVMPDTYAVYHTGKGIDYGCKYTIAIELVSQLNEDNFKLVIKRAVELIKELMEKYSLTKDNIFFHNDFNKTTYCPSYLLGKYKTAKRFANKELKGEHK